jgi:ABC-type multidrug transport system fused ATPase/permease subunit
VLDIAESEPRVRDPVAALPAPSRRPTFALEGVAAAYSPDQPNVLHGVSLTLRPGAKLALVGTSGSGKTTIVNLLLRFLDPVEGRVTLDGRDLREYRQEDVRRALAVAGQDSHLFATTIRENVRLARPDASEADLRDALRRARIWDWVATLPEGIDTFVGEEGDRLSGGQRQRIGLARALLTEAPVLVLDEPAAHLDAETARKLVDDVIDALGGKTLLLVTHRPEGLERMDEIVELDGGRLVGTA